MAIFALCRNCVELFAVCLECRQLEIADFSFCLVNSGARFGHRWAYRVTLIFEHFWSSALIWRAICALLKAGDGGVRSEHRPYAEHEAGGLDPVASVPGKAGSIPDFTLPRYADIGRKLALDLIT